MYDQLVMDVAKQVFTVAAAALASGVVTSLLTQALKWKAISIPASKYPVPVAAVISLIVAIGAVLLVPGLALTGIVGYIVFSVATLLVAVQSYDTVHGAIVKSKE